MAIQLLENIHTIKANDSELRMIVKAVEAGLAAKPERFSERWKEALYEFTDAANKATGVTK